MGKALESVIVEGRPPMNRGKSHRLWIRMAVSALGISVRNCGHSRIHARFFGLTTVCPSKVVDQKTRTLPVLETWGVRVYSLDNREFPVNGKMKALMSASETQIAGNEPSIWRPEFAGRPARQAAHKL